MSIRTGTFRLCSFLKPGQCSAVRSKIQAPACCGADALVRSRPPGRLFAVMQLRELSGNGKTKWRPARLRGRPARAAGAVRPPQLRQVFPKQLGRLAVKPLTKREGLAA